LVRYITAIVGYEQVPFGKQKPAPDGLFLCLAELGLDRGPVFFVGDHETDFVCASRANTALSERQKELRVIAVGADFDGGANHLGWSVKPDHAASAPGDVATLAADYRPSNQSSKA